MTGWWRPLQDPRSEGNAAASREVNVLLDTAYQESARADGKSAALLAIVGIGFTAFAAAGAAAVAAPLRGPAQWLSLAAIAGVCAVAELLLLALRPTLGKGLVGERYFTTWRRYAGAPAVLAAELCADPDDCRTLIDVSCIVWRKYLLIRWAADLLLAIVPVMTAAVSVAVVIRLPPAHRSAARCRQRLGNRADGPDRDSQAASRRRGQPAFRTGRHHRWRLAPGRT